MSLFQFLQCEGRYSSSAVLKRCLSHILVPNFKLRYHGAKTIVELHRKILSHLLKVRVVRLLAVALVISVFFRQVRYLPSALLSVDLKQILR